MTGSGIHSYSELSNVFWECSLSDDYTSSWSCKRSWNTILLMTAWVWCLAYTQFTVGSFQAYERSSLPSKNFPCISMDMLQIGALVLLGRLVEAYVQRISKGGNMDSSLYLCPWEVHKMPCSGFLTVQYSWQGMAVEMWLGIKTH